jgi:REP element-mobilizing transposase RayT
MLMPRNKRRRSETGIYHVMQRGNERKNIFQDEEDKTRYLETIGQIKQGQRFNLYAYCLMDNHIHLMIKEETEEIGKIMQRIAVSYAFYYNQKYRRVEQLQ